MYEILFLLFAFVTVFLSIKLSYYVDYLSKYSKVSGAFLAGILLAGVTSLPEFVTCLSAMFVDNYSLAVGDILGSNIFNIFMICVFDLFFIKKMIFSNMKNSHSLVYVLLLINYVVLYLFTGLFSFNLYFIGVPTLFILITYMFYLYKVSSQKEDSVLINDSSCNHVFVKFIVTAVFMIFSSIILTVIVNQLTKLHPYFSSSFLGAIFLGITTSLPEVITCYSFVNMGSYDLALDDIIGSNFFNLLILAVADFLFKKASLYSYVDSGVTTLVFLGLIFTFMSYVRTNKVRFKCYGLFSFVITVIYLGYWIINFLG